MSRSDPLDGVPIYVDDDLQALVNVHRAEDCVGRCPIHRPSEHHMRGWPLIYRFEQGIFERRCPHGIGHPDPDSMQRRVEFFEDMSAGVHSCDGCCVPDYKPE